MNRMLIPPQDPKQPESIRPPMVYVKKPMEWEYKQIIRNLETEKPLDEAELNSLGKEGWELTGTAQHLSTTHYYFKRQIED